ncbi:TPA: hypothetical protein ACGUT0_002297 [Vibrio vulnificus]
MKASDINLESLSDNQLKLLRAAVNKEISEREKCVWYRWGKDPRWSFQPYRGKLTDKDFIEFLKPKDGVIGQKEKARPRNNRNDVFVLDNQDSELTVHKLEQLYKESTGRSLDDIGFDI